MQRDNNLFMQEEDSSLASLSTQLAGEPNRSTGNIQENNRVGEQQPHEGQTQVIDVTETAPDDTPAHAVRPVPYGLPNAPSNNASTSHTPLSMEDYSNIQNFALQYPADAYSGFDMHALPSLGDGSSFNTGANIDFDIPQQGLAAQFNGQELDESWFYVDPTLRAAQNDFCMGPQGYQNPFDRPLASHQRSAYGNLTQSSGLFQDGHSLNSAYDTSLTVAQVGQQNNIPAGTQVAQPSKRGPGRPQGGRLPEAELMNRIPIRYGGITCTTQGDSNLVTLAGPSIHLNKDVGSGGEASNETAATKQGSRAVAPKTPAKQSRSSTSASPFIKIRPDMTHQELQAAAKHNQSVQLNKIKADRARNNMSAKRGRYKRMACTVSVLDEVYRLSLEVRRAHEELQAEKALNTQLVHQLESAGIPPALPSLPAATGFTSTGTVQNAVTVQQDADGNDTVQRGSSDTPASSPVPAVGTAHGAEGNGKFQLPTDHLALDASWFQKAETTRKELLKDMPQKVAALEGGLLEEMQDVIDKGNLIRGLVASHETNRGTIREQPRRQVEVPPSTPVLSNTTSVKRKTATISNDPEQTNDDDSAVHRSTKKSVKFN